MVLNLAVESSFMLLHVVASGKKQKKSLPQFFKFYIDDPVVLMAEILKASQILCVHSYMCLYV